VGIPDWSSSDWESPGVARLFDFGARHYRVLAIAVLERLRPVGSADGHFVYEAN
jgi:hypothetical protein